MKLTGQSILITGGGSGIGLGLAEAFQQLGNDVIVAGRSEKKLQHAKSLGLKTIQADLSNLEGAQKLAKDALKLSPNLNIVIQNAGVMRNEKFSSRDNSDVATETVFTNFLAPIYLTNALLPHLLKQKEATIMTVTSGLAFLPLAMTPTYCATKAAIHSYTESLRFQLKDTAVEVKELAPPYVATELMGERQAKDPNAMPLKDFIAEVMQILRDDPKAEEILVKNVLPLRNAAFQGAENYQQTFQKRNEMLLQARKTEWDRI